jgi:hypothetical protein
VVLGVLAGFGGVSSTASAGSVTAAVARQIAKLRPSDGAGGSAGASSSAISGNTIAVGMGNAVYVYSKPVTGWKNATESAKLTSSDPAIRFGTSVAISGNTIVVAGVLPNTNPSCGALGYEYCPSTSVVTVFTKSPAAGWASAIQTAELRRGAAGIGFAFGVVATDGNTVVVGQPTLGGKDYYAGAVSVFTKPAGGWTNTSQCVQLTASDLYAQTNPFFYFGTSVAVSGNTVVVGAPGQGATAQGTKGAVYVYTKPTTGWKDASQTAELKAYGSLHLGTSVAISGSTIVAGAPLTGNKGAIYIFTKPVAGWKDGSPVAVLTPSPGGANSYFGAGAAISGRTIAVGAPRKTVHQHLEQGLLYVFTRMAGASWKTATRTAMLTASDGAPGDHLGASVAMSGNIFVAGVARRAAYAFSR